MINTKELRLGNWVYESKSSKFPMQVETISKDYAYLDFENNQGGLFECNDTDMIPIPLNREMLGNLGFEYSSNHIYEHNDDCNLLFDEPNDWNNIEKYPTQIVGGDAGFMSLYVPHGETIIRCLYLHQLQNFFYCITGKELTIKREWL